MIKVNNKLYDDNIWNYMGDKIPVSESIFCGYGLYNVFVCTDIEDTVLLITGNSCD